MFLYQNNSHRFSSRAHDQPVYSQVVDLINNVQHGFSHGDGFQAKQDVVGFHPNICVTTAPIHPAVRFQCRLQGPSLGEIDVSLLNELKLF